ncbi:MAG: shikimate dehydrogenase [Paracoccaceae bacterium]
MTETDDARPLTAGVMGWPIRHSKSPAIFDYWFETYEIGGHYLPLAVAPEDFAEVYRALPKTGMRGVNVTIPHKRAALECADEATEAARAIGAANMIRFSPGGCIVADNTDGYGFVEALRAGAPGWSPAAGPAVVLGAGGASRAILYALREAGCPELRLLNRTRETAEALAGEFGGPIVTEAWEARADALAGAYTIVNATALGMEGNPPLEIALEAAPEGAVVTDIVYAPLETPLLSAARARGLIAVDGLGMLLHQARPAFDAWFGIDPRIDAALREACLAE